MELGSKIKVTSPWETPNQWRSAAMEFTRERNSGWNKQRFRRPFSSDDDSSSDSKLWRWQQQQKAPATAASSGDGSKLRRRQQRQ
nr:hypothetical protein Iba_chr14bCG6200 [Ipomoea batatas]